MLNREMHELRKALDNAGVEWRDDSEVSAGMFFERTKFTNKFGVPCSVIYIKGFSYGWQAELLEVMPPLGRDDEFEEDVQGWLTAKEIIEAWV